MIRIMTLLYHSKLSLNEESLNSYFFERNQLHGLIILSKEDLNIHQSSLNIKKSKIGKQQVKFFIHMA